MAVRTRQRRSTGKHLVVCPDCMREVSATVDGSFIIENRSVTTEWRLITHNKPGSMQRCFGSRNVVPEVAIYGRDE